jgi:hypothetical protein
LPRDSRSIFPLGFPSFISDSGLWPTNLTPRIVRMIDANQPSKNIPSGELIHLCPLSRCARWLKMDAEETCVLGLDRDAEQ